MPSKLPGTHPAPTNSQYNQYQWYDPEHHRVVKVSSEIFQHGASQASCLRQNNGKKAPTRLWYRR